MTTGQEFRLTAIDSLEEIDRAVATVHAHRGEDLAVFATALDKRRGALRDAAFLQLLLTWARLSPQGCLNLLSNSEADAQAILGEACGYAVGLAALATAGSIKIAGIPTQRATALLPGKDRMTAAYQGEFEKLVKGRTVDLLCVSGAERQYLKPLFRAASPHAVKDKFDLKATVRGLAVRAYPNATADLDDSTISALATLTHELFENTQDHAITDVAGRPYRRHVESIFVSWVVLGDVESQNDLTGNETLRRYWKALAAHQPHDRQVAGLCFSFLDSGPGMASRLLSKEYVQMSLEEESDALRNCLRQSVSTKLKRGTGGGFHEVMVEAEQAGGFVRVRSGRQAIFRSFAPREVASEVCDGFENWYADGRELMRVAGTLISVFVPMPRPLT